MARTPRLTRVRTVSPLAIDELLFSGLIFQISCLVAASPRQDFVLGSGVTGSPAVLS